jgi:maleylpyruvate isomerase
MRSLTLYHYWRSSASWRVRWGLECKKISYQPIALDLLASAEKENSYLQNNPAGYVPCLLTPSGPLGESLAILEWLEESYPEHSFLPKDIYMRGRCRQIAETINSGVQPLHNMDVIRKISSETEKQMEWSSFWITRGLKIVEGLLQEIPNRQLQSFCFGAQATLADFCLIPQCYSALRNKVDLSAFPVCNQVYEYALSTYECAASHPDRFKP